MLVQYNNWLPKLNYMMRKSGIMDKCRNGENNTINDDYILCQ